MGVGGVIVVVAVVAVVADLLIDASRWTKRLQSHRFSVHTVDVSNNPIGFLFLTDFLSSIPR